MGPGPARREAYNAKGRQSTAGSRKKGKAKKKDKSELPFDEPQNNANAAILTPKTREEKEAERKEKLLQEVCAFNQPSTFDLLFRF